MDKIVFFDLETGGLYGNKHPVIQIAAIAVNQDNLKEHETFHQRVAFNTEECDEKALAINNYNPDEWKDAIQPPGAISAFNNFLAKHATVVKRSKNGNPYRVAQLAGHNAATFDYPFYRAWAKRHSDGFIPGDFAVLDTVQLARWFFLRRENKPESNRLQDLTKFFGIEHNAHDALSDVQANVEIVRQMRKPQKA